MEKTGGSVAAFIAEVSPAVRRRDAETLVALLSEVSGREPELWGTIIGFGSCHYRYPTGNEGDMPVLAFAPRKAASTIYLDRADRHAEALDRLGPHTTSVACLYIKDLEKVDQGVLRGILAEVRAWTEGGGDEHAQITVND
ncbi:DUF1801 domain-containing protein [Microbacterium sp. NIBRBAC000506063]|uniref:DUF1801 domain-containing protein n=1 Tax=Microbacterium sp. NIBRBAC000506063 TaxID=2734618 RepID=UPI001BB7B3D9|nr:DUF1801 domain-containing protein [Microbacterium sp. NIBRBAC000506063]QTV79017.1 DUF1801 domain-containing protein [Microbacterium sp. NIBRBAC000506063]